MGSDVEAHGMILGAHVIVYSKDADADRAFLRDVIGFTAVDAGRGWLIFELPPTELAVHPAEQNGQHELYLLCTDVNQEMARLQAKGVDLLPCARGTMGLADQDPAARRRRDQPGQPKHPMAITFAPE